MIKGDKSTKVGGRRNSGPAATKKSVATKPKGRPVTMKGGNDAYQNYGNKAYFGVAYGQHEKGHCQAARRPDH